jgi:hypothetical protein
MLGSLQLPVNDADSHLPPPLHLCQRSVLFYTTQHHTQRLLWRLILAMVASSELHKALSNIGRSKKTPIVLVLVTLLILQRRLANRAKRAFGSQRLSAEQLTDATRQLYVDEPDGSRSLLVPFRGRVDKV